MKERIGLYPGTFDPMTLGHADIIGLSRRKTTIEARFDAVAAVHLAYPHLSRSALCRIFRRRGVRVETRLIRALEVSMGTGRPYSTFRKNKQKERNFRSVLIGLTADRETIYRRIDQRVDIMMAQGLLEEVRGLVNKRHLNALNTVGYKELFEHLEGKTSLDDAIAEIKKNTRRFAKRQLTWFKRNENVKWFDFRTPTEEIIEYLIRY